MLKLCLCDLDLTCYLVFEDRERIVIFKDSDNARVTDNGD